MGFIVKLLVLSLAILITAYILPGIVVESLLVVIIAALVLSLINAFIKPILVIITIPVTVFTLGLFLLVINALLLYLVSALVSGFHINTFWWAVLGSIIISLVSGGLNALIKSS